jgi:hypothetical protein
MPLNLRLLRRESNIAMSRERSIALFPVLTIQWVSVDLPTPRLFAARTMLLPGISANLIASSLNSAVNVRRFSIFHLASSVEA